MCGSIGNRVLRKRNETLELALRKLQNAHQELHKENAKLREELLDAEEVLSDWRNTLEEDEDA